MSVHTPSVALTEVLQANHIYYEVIPHRRTESAVAEAEAVGVDPGHVAKTLVLETEVGFVRAVLLAHERIDLHKVKAVLDVREARLASEQVLAGAYPEFELGAVPPVGGPAHDLVLMDARVRKEESVVLEAGTHEQSVRIRTSDLAAVAGARIADIAES